LIRGKNVYIILDIVVIMSVKVRNVCLLVGLPSL
jgi:hypothetical protein